MTADHASIAFIACGLSRRRCLALGRRHAQPRRRPAGRAASPVVVFETAKGTFEIQLFQADAPRASSTSSRS